MVSTRVKRTVVILSLCLLLTLSLFATTLVVGVDRTVLDADFATNAAEEEDVYDTIVEELAREIAADVDSVILDHFDRPAEEIIEDALSDADVSTQMDQNVEQLYEYLHGDRDGFALEFETVAVKDGLESALRDELRNLTARQEQLPTIGGADVGRMTESEAGYDATTTAFRESNPLLPGSEGAVEREMHDELEAQIDAEVDDEAQREAMLSYGSVYVEALVYEEVTYEQFSDSEARERDVVAETMASALREERLDERIDDTYVLTDEDGQFADAIESLQSPVSFVSILSLALPLVTLGLVGLVWWVSISRTMALFGIGVIAGLVGLVTFGGMWFVEGQLTESIRAGLADEPVAADLVIGLLSQAASVFTTQSLALAGVGGVLVVGAGAIRVGKLFITDAPAQRHDTRPAVESEEPVAGADRPEAIDQDSAITDDAPGSDESADGADLWEHGVTIDNTSDDTD